MTKEDVTWRATTTTHNVTVEISREGKSGPYIGHVLASKALQGSTRKVPKKPVKKVDIERRTIKAETYGELREQVRLAIGADFGPIKTFTEDYD